jgi:hypothetical protein
MALTAAGTWAISPDRARTASLIAGSVRAAIADAGAVEEISPSASSVLVLTPRPMVAS